MPSGELVESLEPPPLPDDIEAGDLDREIRAELRSLPKPRAETVARHLVAAGRLVEVDPTTALAHALAARRLVSRIGAVREAVGLAAYHAGEWQTAIAELRTYHRISGRLSHLAVVADCERALGRPERAIDLHRTANREQLSPAEAVELLIVAAGARQDLGQPEAAVAMLQVPQLSAEEATPTAARLRYAYADALLGAGRRPEAREWFARAATVDEEDATDAAERLLELDGVVLEETAEPDLDRTPSADERPDEGQREDQLPEDQLPEDQQRDDQLPEDQPGADEPTEEQPTEEQPPGEQPAAAQPPVDDQDRSEPVPAVRATETTGPPRLVDGYDLVILDLDGVVYIGEEPVPAAVGAIDQLRAEGLPVVFATNNASRAASEVAAVLTKIGVAATADDVLTSAEVAAAALAERLEPGAPVLVVGTGALADEIQRAGLHPVRTAGERPRAVVQGYGPEVGWPELAEAHLAISAGAWWVATNTDRTLPHPRGILPGNGALVAALRTALGREPDLVVGKPQPALFSAAARRAGAQAPLVVGDRLDTDIDGAHRAGMDSLLVLTGVDGRAQVEAVPVESRPTFVGVDLTALLLPSTEPAGSPADSGA